MDSYLIYWVLRKLGLGAVLSLKKQKDACDDPDSIPCPMCNYDCRVVTESKRCPECDWLVSGRSEIVKANNRSVAGWCFWAFGMVVITFGFVGMLTSEKAQKNPWPLLWWILGNACNLAVGALVVLTSYKHIIVDEERIRFVYRLRDDLTIYWNDLATFERKGKQGNVLLFVMNDGHERKWKLRRDLASRVEFLIR